MAETDLRAVVIGAGFAGEGHSKALQQQGVKVETICARNIDVVQSVAKKLGIDRASSAG